MDPTPQMYAELVTSSGFRGLYWMNLGAQSCFGPIFLGSISSAIPHSIIFCSRLKPFQGPGFCFIIYQVLDCKQTLFIRTPLCLSCQDPVVFCPIRGLHKDDSQVLQQKILKLSETTESQEQHN